MKNVIERVKEPTPKFFKVLRTVGLVLLGISGSVIASPVVLPAVVVSVAGYMAVAGGVISAVSQLTVDTSVNLEHQQKDDPSTALRATVQDDKEDSEINSG
ncbi:MAG: hypothetical protein ACI7YS_10705 [Flavobacterium sp.]